jgi:hypothetical protein
MCVNNEKLELANGCLSILTFLSGRKEIKRCFGVAEAVSFPYISKTPRVMPIETNKLLAGVGKTVLA